MRQIIHRHHLLTTGFALCCSLFVDPTFAVDLVGYLPYYRMNANYNANVLPGQLAMLDEIRYFGLTAASNGTVAPLGGSGSLATHLSRIDTIKQAIAALPAADRPRLNVTLGGAGEATNFATVAASDGLRTTFAQNIKSLLDQTGATSVDIDWEHPSAGVQRTTHYPAMLSRIKQELGAERRVYATVDPTVALPNTVFGGDYPIDGLSLMTYDLGWWGNDPGNPNQGEHSLPEYAADAVEAWTEPAGSPNDRPWVFGTWGINAPEDKLGIGLPFYAHTVTSPDATYTFTELVNLGTTSDGNYYMYQGRSAWLPGPTLAAQRVQYAHDQGLQHIIIWEIAQDVHPDFTHADPHKRSLLRAAYEAQQSLIAVVGDYNGDRQVDAADYGAWAASFGLTGDLPADGNNDGVVNAADFAVWRDAMTTAGAGTITSLPVPEPSTAVCVVVLGAIAVARRQLSRRSAMRSGPNGKR